MNGTHNIDNLSSSNAGWYTEPTHGVGQRYWDGQKWTEHVYVSGQQYTSHLPNYLVREDGSVDEIIPPTKLDASRITTGYVRADRIEEVKPAWLNEPVDEKAFYTPGKPKKKKIYWSNLLRIRVWWFSFLSPLAILFLLSFVGLPASAAAVLYIPLVILVGAFWMTQQMACRHCGTVLRVTRLTGGQEVCHKCGGPTDAQIAKNNS